MKKKRTNQEMLELAAATFDDYALPDGATLSNRWYDDLTIGYVYTNGDGAEEMRQIVQALRLIPGDISVGSERVSLSKVVSVNRKLVEIRAQREIVPEKPKVPRADLDAAKEAMFA